MPTKKYKIPGSGKKEIVNLMGKLSRKYSGWEVWQDFIYMTAISIANQCPGKYVDEREETYHKHADNYTQDELNLFVRMIAAMIGELELNQRQDFLGSLFSELELANEWKKQFFTPYAVSEAMARITMGNAVEHVKSHGWTSVHDPACGAGSTLIGAMNVFDDQGVNYQQSVLFVGQDLDKLAGLMCYIQLSLLGCAGYIFIGDTLASPGKMQLHGLVPEDSPNTWITPMYYTDVWQERVRWNYVDMALTQDKMTVSSNKQEQLRLF